MLLAGRTEDASVGLVLLEVSSDAEAREVMKNDPAVKAGVFKAQLDPYGIALMAGR